MTMGPRQRYQGGAILVEDGKIVALGPSVVVPAGVETIDATGMVVTPGLIDAHTHLGLWVLGMGEVGKEHNEETDPLTPHLRASDGLYGRDENWALALRGGVTTVLTGPGASNVVGGQSVVVKTVPQEDPQAMILRDGAGLKVCLGETPKNLYGLKGRAPSTRMGTVALLREALVAAQDYGRQWEQHRTEPSGPPPAVNLKMEALLQALRRETTVRIHAHLAMDIMTGLRIGDEFDLRLVFEHATEGHRVAAELARRQVPVIWGPGFRGPLTPEEKGMTFRTPALLAQAGVKVALTTHTPSLVLPAQYLPILAGQAVKAGLDEDEALRAITLNPAEILEVEARVGSLEVGKDADLVLWSGHPFSYQSRVLLTMVDGQVVYRYQEGDDLF